MGEIYIRTASPTQYTNNQQFDLYLSQLLYFVHLKPSQLPIFAPIQPKLFVKMANPIHKRTKTEHFACTKTPH